MRIMGMTKQEIYEIFVAGIDYGIENGPFDINAGESPFDLHVQLTAHLTKTEIDLTWTVIIAGFNYGANARGKKPSEPYKELMFNNLIEGHPLTQDDDICYTIKDKIEAILA